MGNYNSDSFVCRLFARISTSKLWRRRSSNMAMAAGGLRAGQLKALTNYDDIIVEILSRLPAKSLLRFRCVCKSWRALISDSHFVTKHISNAGTCMNIINCFRVLIVSSRSYGSISPQSMDLYTALNDGIESIDHGQVASRELRFPVKIRDTILMTRILGSCNGLICLEFNCRKIIIWNPSTEQSKVLPKPTYLSYSSLFYGFGYDSTADDYKVIRSSTTALGSGETVIEVYSLKRNSWRRSSDDQGSNYSYLNGKGSFLNGALHFVELQWAKDQDDLRPIGSKIWSFNLAEEKFIELVSLPNLSYKTYVLVGIGITGSCLFAYSDIAGTDVRIWVMKEYGVTESWTKVVKIPSDQILPDGCDASFFKPWCILENGEVLMDYNRNILVLYSPKEKKFRNIAIGPRSELAIYLETLVSPVTGRDVGI